MANEIVDCERVLKAYRSIWNNRVLASENRTCKETLLEAMKRELLDENSHPRVRKDKYEKYYSAVKRIMDSPISMETKGQLIKMYIEVMEEIG